MQATVIPDGRMLETPNADSEAQRRKEWRDRMESKYLKCVKDALEHMPYNFREVKRDGDGSVQYATEISNTRGMLTKTMDIIVDEKQNSIVMRS